MNKRSFVKRSVLWVAAAPFLLTPKKSLAQSLIATRSSAFKVAGAGSSTLAAFVDGCTVAQINAGKVYDTQERWIPIVADATGTATRLRLYIQAYVTNDPFKLALYNNSGNLLSGCTAAITPTATGWWYGTLSTPQSISNGTTYRLSYMASGNWNSVGYYNASSITESYNYNTPPTYAAFPGATLQTPAGTNANTGIAVGFGGDTDAP
jgi:hypothetical protein